MRHALVLSCVLAAMPAAADPVADAAAARRVEEALGGLSSLRAEFRQSVTDAQGQIIEQAEGTMALARPGRFRWDYRVPEQLIVSDGRTVWFHDVELEQVTIRAGRDRLGRIVRRAVRTMHRFISSSGWWPSEGSFSGFQGQSETARRPRDVR